MTPENISDTERREVARRLRELHLGGGSKDLIERTLSDAIGAWRKNGMSWDFITERLADLIEPPIQCPYYHSDRHYCSAYDDVVDRDALLALADEMERIADENRMTGMMGIGRARSWADRIREALGVADA